MRMIQEDLEMVEPDDRLDEIFASIDRADHAARIVALADAPELASDAFELDRMFSMENSAPGCP